MFDGSNINRLIKQLEDRGACLYHACQFVDFQSYLAVGGIPSRALLEQNKQVFTAFETDTHDHETGVWDKVFVNLSDFGRTFASGGDGVPNPYGPILLQMHPAALAEAREVAVCLRSAGANGFNRGKEALTSLDDVNRLFRYPTQAGFPESSEVKYVAELRIHFPGARDPEISCTVDAGKLSLQHLIVVWVDPYTIHGKPLLDFVAQQVMDVGMWFNLRGRNCRDGAIKALYNELASELINSTATLSDLGQRARVSSDLRFWAGRVARKKLEYQFERYARYLLTGTLRPLLGVSLVNPQSRRASAPIPLNEELPF
ncbi:MAG: hypothetical protein M3R24_15535 [Chloroflexota bacterium]|nr:hypothetical protein [Chloroflexota bacterium]